MDKERPRRRVYIVQMGRLTWTRVSPIRALRIAIQIKKHFPEARVRFRSEVRDWYPRA